MTESLRKLLLVLAAQIPLLGAGYAWWTDKFKVNPILAASVTVLYELGLFGFGLVSKAWKELEPEVIKALTTFLRTSFLNLISGFRRNYLQQIRWEHRDFNVRGLRTQGAYSIELDQVFVELRIAPSHVQQASADPIAERELPYAGPIWDFLRPITIKGATALSIIGPPGSGKTTLLQYIALTFAENRQRRFRVSALTPVFLFLRNHIEAITQNPSLRLSSLVEAHATQKSRLTPPSDWFEKTLRQGRAIVLLDGLDEVAQKEQRIKISQWIDQQISAYPQCPFVVTARPEGYRSAPLQRAHVVEVLPFGTEQVRQFVKNWYLATGITSHGGKLDGGVRREAENRAQDLLTKLRSHYAFGELTRNPLLLTMIAMVHNYRGALPGRRVELYTEICDVLLGHWQKSKEIETPLTAAQLRVVLQPLAAYMMQARAREIHTDQALNLLQPELAKIGIEGDVAQSFLTDVQARSGLLLERETGRWGFAHLTFQEYLAATHFQEKGWNVDLSTVVEDSWWEETLRLYAAQANATPILEACLRSGSKHALALAAECIDEAKEADPSVRKQMNDILGKGLESTDPDRFRIAAEVRLRRRIRALHRIDDEHSIDLEYVTCAEYQLFIDDMNRRGYSCQPDHWQGLRFLPGHANDAVVGVRPTDAEEFSIWLTRREGTTALYRLPTAKEAADFPARSSFQGTWCLNDKGLSNQVVSLSDVDSQVVLHTLSLLVKNSPFVVSDRIPLPPSIDSAVRSFIATSSSFARDVCHSFLTPLLDRKLASIFDRENRDALVLARALSIEISDNLPVIRTARTGIKRSTGDAIWSSASELVRLFDSILEFTGALSHARAIEQPNPNTRAPVLSRSLEMAKNIRQLLQQQLRQTFELVYELSKSSKSKGSGASVVLALTSPKSFFIPLTTVDANSSATDRALASAILLHNLLYLLLADDAGENFQLQVRYSRDLVHYLAVKISRININTLPSKSIQAYKVMLELYWFLHLIDSRRSGTVPAIGGIRLVRETPRRAESASAQV